MSTDTSATARPVAARVRLLAAAARIFYSEGIHSVPVDRIIAEAGVTRATFYRHFPSKEDLVRAWLDARDQEIRAGAAATAQILTAATDLLRALVDNIADEVCRPNFRGCSFINAAAEYPDPDHPVHVAVTTHRIWFRDTLVQLLVDMGHPEPDAAGRTLVMLRDGAMVAGYLDTPDAVRAQLTHAFETLIADRAG